MCLHMAFFAENGMIYEYGVKKVFFWYLQVFHFLPAYSFIF